MTTTSEDEKAVRALVAQLEAAWNAGDSMAFVANMVEEVVFTNVLGDRHIGRHVVERGHRHVFDTIYKGSSLRYAVEDIRFLARDIAIAATRQTLMSHLPSHAMASTARQMQVSDAMHESQARGTVVLKKEGGRWQIVTVHNTAVAIEQRK